MRPSNSIDFFPRYSTILLEPFFQTKILSVLTLHTSCMTRDMRSIPEEVRVDRIPVSEKQSEEKSNSLLSHSANVIRSALQTKLSSIAALSSCSSANDDYTVAMGKVF